MGLRVSMVSYPYSDKLLPLPGIKGKRDSPSSSLPCLSVSLSRSFSLSVCACLLVQGLPSTISLLICFEYHKQLQTWRSKYMKSIFRKHMSHFCFYFLGVMPACCSFSSLQQVHIFLAFMTTLVDVSSGIPSLSALQQNLTSGEQFR